MLTDGRPLQEAAVALAILAFVFGFARRLPVGAERSIAAWLWGRGLFRVDDLPSEAARLGMLRVIVMSTAAAIRLSNAADAAASGDPALWAHLAGAALAMLLAAGVAVPLAGLAFCLVTPLVFDNVSGVSSLVSRFQTMCAWVFALAPAGPAFALDGPLGSLVRRLYSAVGGVTAERAALVRFSALVSFGCLNLWAAVDHLQQPAWRDGTMLPLLFLSPTLVKGSSATAQQFYAFWPLGYAYLGMALTWGMVAWQLLTLPLVLAGRWTRAAWLAWCIAFFLSAEYVLNIRTLGITELLFLLVLFWSGPLAAPLLRLGGPTAGLPMRRGAGIASLAAVGVFAVLLLLRLAVGGPAERPSATLEVLKATVGQSFQAVGIGPVSVFTELDLASTGFQSVLVPQLSLARDEADPLRPPGEPFSALQLSTQDAIAGRRIHRTMAARGDRCPTDAQFEQIESRFPRPLGAMQPPLAIEYRAVLLPTPDDLRAGRYVAVESLPYCGASFDAGTRRLTEIVFYPGAIRRTSPPFPLGGPVTRAGAALLARFPCAAELQRLGYWFDRLPQTPATASDATELRGLFEARIDPPACAVATMSLASRLGVVWSALGARDALGPCRAELDAAARLRAAAPAPDGERFDEALRLARALESAGAQAACARQADAIRQAYLIAIAAPSPGRSPVVAAEPGASRAIPCRAEADRIAWWLDRAATPAAALHAQALFRTADGDPGCLEAATRAAEAMGIDWMRYPPRSLASCAQERVLAEAHLAAAPAPLASVMREAVDRARALEARGAMAECAVEAAYAREIALSYAGFRQLWRAGV